MTKFHFTFIDNAKFIGLILILFCHIPLPINIFHEIIYAFHVPLFFIISGLFIKPTTTIKESITKDFNRLIIPYITFNIILICIQSIIDFFYGFDFYNCILSPIIGIFYGSSKSSCPYPLLAGPSWFLVALFIAKNIALIVLKIKKQYQIISCIIILLLYYILNDLFTYHILSFDSALLGALFVLFGYYLRKRVLNLPNLTQKKYFYSILLLLLLSPILACNGISNMFKGEFGNNIILFFVNGLVGSLLLLLLCAKVNFQSNFLKIIIGGSIFFIVFHTFIMEYVMLIYKKIMFLLTKVPILEVNIIEKCIITIITTLIIYLILKVFKSKIPIFYK